ncbi:delta-aminolevulinic acid dehydratase [Lusitaniella coriacea LEGE 07157]|uniref:Delta-aminolevulinic acid dehydratase n=1 Tax=Lusitaniella coriacea LEGE 07157 TaxID=945747 RepID=A0A8J7DX07_9CYAN|nr:delta-aminolevulinic acid dehydratase [Lusitaniella coriacea LEGE 07157]
MTLIDSNAWHHWVDQFCTVLFFGTVVGAFWFASRMD